MDIREYRPSDEAAVQALGAADVRIVAEHDERVIGCAGYAVAGGAVSIQGLAVDPAFRRMGVGRFLLMYALRAASRESSPRLATAVVPAASMGFFEKLGFRAEAEPEGRDGAAGMVKKLEVCG